MTIDPGRARVRESIEAAARFAAPIALVVLGCSSAADNGAASAGAGGGRAASSHAATSHAATSSTSASSSSTGAPATCPATSDQAFSATAWTPPHAHVAACSDAELQDYQRDCLDATSAIPIACEQFATEHAACKLCLSPDDTSHGAGALRAVPGSPTLNVGGCIALELGDSSATGCGAREQTAADCATFACAACPSDVSCPAKARKGACAKEEMKTCTELTVAASCKLDQGFAADYLRIAKVFCGTP